MAQDMDGLWTAEFGSSAGSFGGGVAVFQSGKILGGDGTYFYIGSYTIEGQHFQATLKSSAFIEGARSVFNTTGQDLTLQLDGSLTGEGQALARGSANEVPTLKFAVRLTKRG
jgi:T3SS negative regulator,GrlR